jgi:hypothetical protein
MGAGISDEGGGPAPNDFEAHLILAIYPVLIWTAFIYRRKQLAVVWLPILGLMAPFLLLATLATRGYTRQSEKWGLASNFRVRNLLETRDRRWRNFVACTRFFQPTYFYQTSCSGLFACWPF